MAQEGSRWHRRHDGRESRCGFRSAVAPGRRLGADRQSDTLYQSLSQHGDTCCIETFHQNIRRFPLLPRNY